MFFYIFIKTFFKHAFVPPYLKRWPKWQLAPSSVPAWTTPTVLYGTTQKNISKLQKAQNLLARAGTCSPRSSQSSSYNLLQHLHWLPIKHRINFKIANINFRTLQSSQPASQIRLWLTIVLAYKLYLLTYLLKKHQNCQKKTEKYMFLNCYKNIKKTFLHLCLLQSSDVTESDAGHLADVSFHRQFVVRNNSWVTYRTHWLDRE